MGRQIYTRQRLRYLLELVCESCAIRTLPLIYRYLDAPSDASRPTIWIIAGAAGGGPQKKSQAPQGNNLQDRGRRVIAPQVASKQQNPAQEAGNQAHNQQDQGMLMDTPVQDEGGVLLGGAHQGAGASTPSPATQGAEVAEPNTQVL